MSEDQNPVVTALEQRVATLEASLAEHRRAFEAILASPSMKMSGLRPGELLAVSRLTTTPAARSRKLQGKDLGSEHELARRGDKLRALSGELQR
jgi:uncharacterized membrane-anchored protein